jgi:bilin biosynthesis protein|tara:strand:+ start:1585 stop:2214 length:630 start_codon:yes stop_codon:yes gene_type:complete
MSSSSNSIDSLFADLAHPNPNIRFTACSLLAEQFPEEAMPRLFDLMHDPDPGVYRTAVKALGMIGHQSVPNLIQLFNSSDNGTIRACCIKAIVQVSVSFPDDAFSIDTLTMLEKALDDDSPVVAQSALMTLGHLSKQASEEARVIPLLIKACDSSNIAHVQGAAMSLAELDSPLVNQCLQGLAEDESKDELIREVAQASLERRQSLGFD